jgi:diguanylate cyclase (GGDEF)-like protein
VEAKMDRVFHLVENFSTSNHIFDENETILKYRFLFINWMTLFLILYLPYEIFYNDIVGLDVVVYSLLFISFVFISSIRYNKSYFDISITIAIVLVFIIFSRAVFVLQDDSSQMLFYFILIFISFVVKGYLASLYIYLSSMTMVLFFWIYFPTDFSMTLTEIARVNVAYFFLMVFLFFLDFVYNKHEEVLTEANLRVKLLNQSLEEKNQTLSYKLRVNSLSELPNRFALNEKMNIYKDKLSLIFLDLDNFGSLNRLFGSDFTDQILIQVARELKLYQSDKIELFHIGSDEFVFLIENFYVDQDINFIKSLQNIFSKNIIKVLDVEIFISFSVGIARAKNKSEYHNLFENAKIALESVKNSQKNSYRLYVSNKKRELEYQENLFWVHKIRKIINNNQLIVIYQPIVDAQTQEISKYECLVRAKDNNKMISPSKFLAATKLVGLIPSLTKIVIDKSFQEFQYKDVDFSINITDEDIKADYLVEYIMEKLSEYNIDPSRVALEILENITLLELDRAKNQFNRLKEVGLKIYIDDFGSDASNFSRFLQLDVDVIKIDGQFIKNIDKDINSLKIVESIVALANKIGVKTVAEFVHCETIYECLKPLGIDFFQGNYFSEPLLKIK